MRNVAGILALCVLATSGWCRDNLVVPLEANALAKAHGCDQVADFFDHRPAVEDPPYALIAGDGNKLQIAVWCTRDLSKPDGSRLYTLLIHSDDTASPLAQCRATIDNIKHIGGLRFVDIADDARDYFFVGTQDRVPLKGKLSTKGIVSSYDGVEERYICLNGKWAFRALD
jgi:hypothetical protein